MVDTENVKNGKVRFELDQDRMNKMLDISVPATDIAAFDAADVGGRVRSAGVRATARAKAIEAVANLNRVVNEDLRALATVETLRRGEEEIDFERAWVESQFNVDFGELDGSP